MPSTYEILENKKVKLTITVDKADFVAAIQRAYIQHRKTITIPGFRKGRAPLPIIENFYGKDIFNEDAFEDIFRTTYMQAIQEHDIQDVDRPDVDIVELVKGSDVVYTAEVTVKPDAVLGDYKGKSVQVVEKVVSDEDIDAEINKAAEQISRQVDVTDRAAALGDKVTIDYAGTVDEVAFEGGAAQDHELELGSNSFIPGFEDQVVGMNIDEEKDINITFPDEYQSEDLQGKDAVFKVVLHAIKVKEMPEIDDEFVKDVSEFDTLDEYKLDIRTNLEKTAADELENQTQNAIVNLLIENTQVDIPECMIDNQVDSMLREMNQNFTQQGFSLEQYMQITGMTMDTLKEQYKAQAETRVKSQLAIEAVQVAQAFEVSEEEIEAEIVRMSELRETDVETIRKTFEGPNAQYLKDSVLSEKTMNFLKEAVVIEKVESLEEET